MKRSLFALHVMVLCTLCLALPALLPGCVTTPRGSALKAAEERAAREALEEARAAIKEGVRAEVVPQLDDVIAGYPGTEAATEAHYFLGLVYAELGKYREAYGDFREYVRLAPEGKYAQKCAEYGGMINRELEIKKLKAQLEKEPGTLAYQWELADLLWKRGDFEEAAELYLAIVAAHPEYAEDATFMSRIEMQPDGRHVLLTPAEVVRRQAEAQPIVIINVSTFRTGQRESDFYGMNIARLQGVAGYRIRGQERQFAVTGQALNRSKKTLYGVQVYVTVYGIGSLVLDTTTVNIGRLGPGEIRAFSVKFDTFESIDDVYRCECVGTFQR